jgi:adenine deaminase
MKGDVERLRKRILAGRGEVPSDLVIKRGKVVNVFTGEILERDVAICDGVVVGLGSGYAGKEEIDAAGKWIVPGLIDAHLHIESAMLLPSLLAEVLAIHGTTTILSDPHEMANVMGKEGVRLMIEDSRSACIDIYFTAPSCVPATFLESAGARLSASDLAGWVSEPKILGLGEVMDVPGILSGEEDLLKKVILFGDKLLEGHSPLLRGRDLQAYLTAGIRSDHETSSLSEAAEKVESGMVILIREGTSARNLLDLLPLVNPLNSRRFCLVSDDLHPLDLLERGHLDFSIRKAIQWGLPPVLAIQLATLNPAEYLGLKDRGAVAPGYRADLVLLDDLEGFSVSSVYRDGRLLVHEGKFPGGVDRRMTRTPWKSAPLKISPLTVEDFGIRHPGGTARVIELVPGQIITRMILQEVPSRGGWVLSDVQGDLLKLAVVERHHGTGRIGLGLVRGFGLKRGALASSVAHDSHNVICVGVDDAALFRAVQEVKGMGGGLVVVGEGETLARVPLPIAGLMSDESLPALANRLRTLEEALFTVGCPLEEPFMALSFLALPVIPELKLTDKGLVDVNRFEMVPLFLGK